MLRLLKDRTEERDEFSRPLDPEKRRIAMECQQLYLNLEYYSDETLKQMVAKAKAAGFKRHAELFSDELKQREAKRASSK